MGQLSSVVTTQITMKVTIVLCLVITAISAKRDPKLFFVSTSSTTSTLSTITTCYTTTGTVTACGSGRRKRSITIDDAMDKDGGKIVDPSPIEPSIGEPEAKSERQGKFLLYWLTTTTTSTSTSFTTTQILTIVCTAT